MARARRLKTMIRRFARNESGATAIEYALVGSGIAGAVVAAVYALGDNVKSTFFDAVANRMQSQ